MLLIIDHVNYHHSLLYTAEMGREVYKPAQCKLTKLESTQMDSFPELTLFQIYNL